MSSAVKDFWMDTFSLYRFSLPMPPYPSKGTRLALAIPMYALGATLHAFGLMLHAMVVTLHAFTRHRTRSTTRCSRAPACETRATTRGRVQRLGARSQR